MHERMRAETLSCLSALYSQHYDIDRHFKDLELRVVVVTAMHLPKQDTWGTCDAYCVVKLGEEEFKTHVLKNTLSPHWEEGGNFELYWVSSLSFLILPVSSLLLMRLPITMMPLH